MHWTEPDTADDSHAALENTLWDAVNQLWSNAALKPSEYSPTVLGLIVLCYANVRFTPVMEEIQPQTGSRRKIGPTDFHAAGVVYLPDEARFFHLLSLPEGEDEGKVINDATYYEDFQDSVGRFDFVLANPHFNVSKINKERFAGDPRYSFGIPHTDNGNYLWIQHFYSALNKKDRAGFVMANSAADARASEQEIREKIIRAGHVDATFIRSTAQKREHFGRQFLRINSINRKGMLDTLADYH